MLSAIVLNTGSPHDLAALLAALVPAAVEGLVREVLVAGEAGPGVAALCEDAGAVLLPGGLPAAVSQARQDRLLIAPSTFMPAETWVRSLGEHLARGGRDAVISGFQGRRFWGAEKGHYAVMASRSTALNVADLKGLRRRLTAPARL